jgi:hypothetical protein
MAGAPEIAAGGVSVMDVHESNAYVTPASSMDRAR